MLADRHCELLTAYVDGELNARDRQAADQLLATSPEAREFLQELLSDSKELRNLPQRRSPASLTQTVMDAVAETQAVPRRRAPSSVDRPARGIPRWLGFAVAACVLAAVGAGTFLLSGLLLRENGQGRSEIAKAREPHVSEQILPEGGLRLSVAQLHEEPTKKRLSDQLNAQPSVWLDVPAANNKQAAAALVAALQKTGITVLVDQAAKVNLAKKQQQVRYALYVENMTQAEAVQFFQDFAQVEQKVAGAKAVDYMVMTDLSATKRSELASAMHLDPLSLDRDSWQELPELIEVPKGAAGNQAVAAKALPRFAMLLALNGGGAPGQSPELRRFLDARQRMRQGTVQMVLVIHVRTG